MKLSQRRQSGFSTLELMMAIVVLAIAVIGASLIPALSLGRNTDAKTYAANVAREVLDTYRGIWLNRDSFQKGLQPVPNVPTGLRFGCVVAAPDIEALELDPSYDLVLTAGTPVMRRISVSVQCGQKTKVELSTLIGDPQPGSK
jgi:type II secretory pathway pseudopilin PulG